VFVCDYFKLEETMYRFKDLFVTLLPEGSKLAQDQNAARGMVFIVRNREAIHRQNPGPPPSTGCCDTAMSEVGIFIPNPLNPGDPPDTLRSYLNTEMANAVLATDQFRETGDLQSIAEVERMEKKLEDAQGELRMRKAQLQKQPTITK
jgi:hypothetical protein